MRLHGPFAKRTALCLVTTMAFVGAHELVHIAVGQALGLGTHFTSLTSAHADPTRALAATPGSFFHNSRRPRMPRATKSSARLITQRAAEAELAETLSACACG
jgi:hypothetical protein